MRLPKLPVRLILLVLGIYILLQLLWWAYIILDLQTGVYGSNELRAKQWMILGEGMVFLALLVWGFLYLNRTLRKEIELAKVQRNFLLSITHEIKTPLAAMRLTLQTLQRHRLDVDQTDQLLNKALSEQERLEAMLDNVMIARTLDARQWVTRSDDINLKTHLQQLVRTAERKFEGRTIQWNCPEEVRLSVDTRALEIIVGNLLDNAFKYSPPDTVVQLSAWQSVAGVHVIIEDKGPGIPESERERVLRKFYRIEDERTRRAKGTGLGLYLVKSFVSMYNGSLRILPRDAGGTRMEVILPES